jgi:hypothetical protein
MCTLLAMGTTRRGHGHSAVESAGRHLQRSNHRGGTGAADGKVARAALRGVLVVTALGFVAIGVTVLTDPLYVPVTVALWLCGAALLGLAAVGQFQAD